MLVIDRRDHIAGNVYTENVHGINVHRYGAHIFHTSNKEVWDYVNQFAEFNNYINSPIAIYKDELYNLPFKYEHLQQALGHPHTRRGPGQDRGAEKRASYHRAEKTWRSRLSPWQAATFTRS